jgi:elongation factor G
MSQGTGTFDRAFLRYEPLPSHLADKVAKAEAVHD